MAQPIVNDLPAAPTRGEDPAVFAAKANAFAGSLPSLASDVNQLGAWMNTAAQQVATMHKQHLIMLSRH